jgi:glycosyltransferase involved in cell wall biosynthesis
MKVLWLASWYPDEYEPTNGDFVQRHAKAVSTLIQVDVIHITQAGKDKSHLHKIVLNDDENLHEAIHYFAFKKTGITFIDKVRYNRTYFNYYKNILKKYINEKGEPDLIHIHVPMKAGLLVLWLKKEFNIPYIVSEHSSLYLKAAEDNFDTRSFYFRHNTKKIFQQASLVTNVSSAIAKVLQQKFGLNDIRIIPNVVDTNHFYFKPKEKNKIFRWLHVSTMYPLKNVDKIIQTFASIGKQRDDWELILVGPINTEYKKLVANLNLQSKIKFIGEVTHKEVSDQMQQSDAFIMFSRHENFPCVIIEALCCGLPVVSSNVGGIAEAVDHSNGILIEANNTDQLQTAIVSVMDNPAQFNAEKITAEASSKYNYTTVAHQFLNIYQDVLNLKSFP